MSHAFTGDRIILNDLGFYGYHGVFPEEAKLGQRFFVDLQIGIDLRRVCRSDELADGISYADIHAVVETAFGQRMKLLEAVGQNIADALFANFDTVGWIIVRVRKPEAPIPMVRGEAAIELHRVRES